MPVIRLLLLTSLLAAPVFAQPAPARPNIVFFLVDDLRFDAMGIHGDYWATPNLDALARDGVLLENAFVTTSLCAPSRASILTGMYAHRHGVLNNETLMPNELTTFPREFQRAGYHTGFCGKWHVGGNSAEPRPGFDRWVSFPGQGAYINQVFNVDGAPTPRKGHTTDIITDYALDFLRTRSDKPFMLYVSHKGVHAPFTPTERHRGTYSDRAYPYPDTMPNTEENYAGKPDWVRRQRNSWHGVDGLYNNSTTMDKFAHDYAEALMAVDDSLGKLRATLEELGLLSSTLIVVTSDNGFQFGEHGLIDKRTMYEASIRVPMIAYGPGLFEGGRRVSGMALNIDIAPTLLEAAGIAIPASMQGRSFLPILKDANAPWRDAFLYEYFWERSFPQTPTVLGVRTDKYKFMKFQGVWDRYELYDIQADPGERNNLLGGISVKNEGGPVDMLIRSKADPAVKPVFDDMQKQLDALLSETGALDEPSWTDQGSE